MKKCTERKKGKLLLRALSIAAAALILTSVCAGGLWAMARVDERMRQMLRADSEAAFVFSVGQSSLTAGVFGYGFTVDTSEAEVLLAELEYAAARTAGTPSRLQRLSEVMGKAFEAVGGRICRAG